MNRPLGIGGDEGMKGEWLCFATCQPLDATMFCTERNLDNHLPVLIVLTSHWTGRLLKQSLPKLLKGRKCISLGGGCGVAAKQNFDDCSMETFLKDAPL